VEGGENGPGWERGESKEMGHAKNGNSMPRHRKKGPGAHALHLMRHEGRREKRAD